MGSGNVKVGESEAHDVATSLPPYMSLALERRTYVIAAHGWHYIQFHGGPAPKLFAEIVSNQYLAHSGTPWAAQDEARIREWGYALGKHNHQRMYDEGESQLSDAASTAEAFFLGLAGKPPGALVEYWMGPGESGLGPRDVEVTLQEPTPIVVEPRELTPVPVARMSRARKTGASTRYKELNR